MLRIVTCPHQLPVGELTELYAEEIRMQGKQNYPRLSPWEQQAEAEQDFLWYLREAFFSCPGNAWCLWEIEGVLVSALRLQAYRDGLLLEGLVTAPAHRGRGNASELIRAVVARIRPARLYAHIQKENDASAAVHEKCGFRRILEYSVLADGSFSGDYATYLYEMPAQN